MQTTAAQVDCTISIVGSGNLVIQAIDLATNIGSGTETNYIVDLTAPIITVNGSGTVTVEGGTVYTEL